MVTAQRVCSPAHASPRQPTPACPIPSPTLPRPAHSPPFLPASDWAAVPVPNCRPQAEAGRGEGEGGRGEGEEGREEGGRAGQQHESIWTGGKVPAAADLHRSVANEVLPCSWVAAALSSSTLGRRRTRRQASAGYSLGLPIQAESSIEPQQQCPASSKQRLLSLSHTSSLPTPRPAPAPIHPSHSPSPSAFRS